jgi:hypothetical protein
VSTVRAEFLDGSSPEWAAAESLAIGRRAPASEPDARVGVMVDEAPTLRVDVFTNLECTTFSEALCIAPVVAIGYGGHVHFVNVRTREAKAVELSGYFGALYTAEEMGLPDRPFDFLVASADSLLRFSADGSLLWRAERLGIDGVRVDDVVGCRIDGSGEWDPPGGWKPFAVDLATGHRIA